MDKRLEILFVEVEIFQVSQVLESLVVLIFQKDGESYVFEGERIIYGWEIDHAGSNF